MRKPHYIFLLALISLSACAPDTSQSSISDDVSGTSDETESSSTSHTPPAGDYRLNPVAAAGEVGYAYDEYGEVIKELYRDDYYTDLEDVAAYLVTFGALPINYYYTTERGGYSESKQTCYGLYSNACRIFPGEYYSNYDYLPYSLDGLYNEADIGDEYYALSSSWNRGVLRVIFTLTGIDAYGQSNPLLFYTDDHYENFIEYKNYYGGWSEEFGDGGAEWSALDTWEI